MTTGLLPDEDTCYRAVSGRDHRFDGWIYVGVTSTKIYCRPSCPAITPKQRNCTFHPTAGAAQAAGFRACRRCRPDAVPGSPLWQIGTDVVARSMRLISEGVVDREGVTGLAARVGYSTRQLNRLLIDHAGASPVALARAQRAHAARLLLEGSDLPLTDLAYAAGFGSLRQFNDTIREVFACTPTDLRSRSGGVGRRGEAPGRQTVATITVRLATREPFALAPLWAGLARHVVPGLESSSATEQVASLHGPSGPAAVRIMADPGGLRADLALVELGDLSAVLARVRRLLDLDADSHSIDATLAADPIVAPLVAATPGIRIPGTLDADELALRTVIGQQISIPAAITAWGKLARLTAAPLPDALIDQTTQWGHRLEYSPPRAAAIAALDPEHLAMPRSRARALVGLAAALASGEVELNAGSDRHRARAQLDALPGIGPWTSGRIAMRALGDPDIDLVDTDLIARRSAERLGLSGRDRFAPWRSYLTHHLWLAALPVEQKG